MIPDRFPLLCARAPEMACIRKKGEPSKALPVPTSIALLFRVSKSSLPKNPNILCKPVRPQIEVLSSRAHRAPNAFQFLGGKRRICSCLSAGCPIGEPGYPLGRGRAYLLLRRGWARMHSARAVGVRRGELAPRCTGCYETRWRRSFFDMGPLQGLKPSLILRRLRPG